MGRIQCESLSSSLSGDTLALALQTGYFYYFVII